MQVDFLVGQQKVFQKWKTFFVAVGFWRIFEILGINTKSWGLGINLT
jgi:hypothetical protein